MYWESTSTPHVGLLGADALRGAQAVVGVGGRHAHVDDRDVGLVRGDLADQVVGVSGLPDDVEAGIPEEANDPLPEEY